MRPDIAVVLTCYNRKPRTVNCLESVRQQTGSGSSFTIRVILVDASSTDGTAEEVRSRFPEVVVASVPDSIFWGGGMRRATEIAQTLDPDYILWLNDDVVLDPPAIQALLEVSTSAQTPCVAVGQVRDAAGVATYGGMLRGRWPLQFDAIGITTEIQAVDTFNGNVVLLPSCVTDLLGGPDPHFPHTMGDVDYGLRATARGVLVRQAGGSIGVCERNAPRKSGGPKFAQLRATASVKQFPPRAWWKFCLRHAGVLAPVYFCKPYVTALSRDRS